ncbi:sulfatase [Flavilitoribacter nigricans]|uniref:Arylsulfatase n=1 Tax=Flavilitoribacter nigricans (strain ATCC 23147 / DSM 23189 / NBRC 102662 / NCIMB 1420 / SS-2) TaxID=1122177 RepID=A0A2D0N059_FLAN2|nr:sulfatase [Flavilitoribacter nigricans]PHN01768.1 arylsulfatase [Flavilitoribacter nigricans DSM 23189 = NBRC 102662]
MKSNFTFLLSLLFLLSLIACRETAEEKEPLNVVFILVDDLGWKDLGCYGSEFYETPNIDRLAASGQLFTNAYAASPVCSPTRAAILTGKYPSRVGITDWIKGNDPKNRRLLGPQDLHELPLEEVTMAEAFKEHGYHTFFAGKWHLGDEGYFPEQQGFDFNLGGHHMGQPPGGYYSPYKNPKLSDGPEGEYLTDRLTDESIRFIREKKDQPFLLYLSYYTVHTPIQANRTYVGRFQEKKKSLPDTVNIQTPEHDASTITRQTNADYASMVYALDQNVGRLLDTLESLDLMDHTMVIFTSDNGGLSTLANPNRIAPTSVRPLRAGKGWCYEGGIRVPLIISMPGAEAGGEIAEPVISTDFYPTTLEFAGLAARPDQHQDGLSLLPILKGENTLDREALYWHYPHYHGSGWKGGSAIRVGNWKLIEFYEEEKMELYDLSQDLEEQHDLLAENPEKARELKKQLEAIQKTTNAQFPTENPEFAGE